MSLGLKFSSTHYSHCFSQNVETRVKAIQTDIRGIEEGKVRNSRDRELRAIRDDLGEQRREKQEKKARLKDVKAFHLLFEEVLGHLRVCKVQCHYFISVTNPRSSHYFQCLEWFYKGVQTFSHQPVEQCSTLEGICGLEQELDRHLSRCPVQVRTLISVPLMRL